MNDEDLREMIEAWNNNPITERYKSALIAKKMTHLRSLARASVDPESHRVNVLGGRIQGIEEAESLLGDLS